MNEQRKHLKWAGEGLKIKSFTDGDDFKSFIVKEIDLRTSYVYTSSRDDAFAQHYRGLF